MKDIHRGGIFLARLARKEDGVTRTRAVLVVSNDIGNRHSGTVTVLPVTSRNVGRVYPFEILLPPGTANLSNISKVKADQIRTLDRDNIIKFVGSLEENVLSSVEQAIRIHLGL